jgi:hypothetical protein
VVFGAKVFDEQKRLFATLQGGTPESQGGGNRLQVQCAAVPMGASGRPGWHARGARQGLCAQRSIILHLGTRNTWNCPKGPYDMYGVRQTLSHPRGLAMYPAC